MAVTTTRTAFKDYCLRRLGFPVIEINVDEDQIQDRIDDALLYYQDYHFDGLQKVFYIKAIDQTDIDNKYLNLTEARDSSNNALEITGITRIFPVTDSQSSINMFDLRYQLRLNELYDFTSASYINYTLTQQHLRSLELMFTGEVPIRFQRHMQRLYIDWAWGYSEAPAGTVVVAECYTPLYDKWIKTLSNPEETLRKITERIPLEKRMTTGEEIANIKSEQLKIKMVPQEKKNILWCTIDHLM